MSRTKTTHQHQMLNLPYRLIQALKSRSTYTGVSMSSFVTRVLTKELGLEEKKEKVNEFHTWANYHCYPDSYQFNYTFYHEHRQKLIVNEVIKPVQDWTKEQSKDFFNLFSDVRRTTRKLTVEDVLELKVINVKNFIKYYKLNWTVPQ